MHRSTLVVASSFAAVVVAQIAGSGAISNLPPDVKSEVIDIFPTVTNPFSYFLSDPAAYSTYIAAASSIIANNPTVFPSLAGEISAGSNIAPSLPGGGVGRNTRAPDFSLISEYSAIMPTVTNPSAYFDTRPAAFTTYFNELSSLVVNNPTYFGGSIVSDFKNGPMETGRTRRQLFSATNSPTPGGDDPFGVAESGGLSSGGPAQNTPAQSTSATNSPNFARASQTPVLGLGLSGAAVAGIAGLAALL